MHEVQLKFLHILFTSFATDKSLPCRKKIFQRNDMLVAMDELHNTNNPRTSPPPTLLPILQKVKDAYLLWFQYYQTIPKLHRYSLGERIDRLFIEIIEAIASAGFLSRAEKQPYVRLAIRKLDTGKILLMVLWESKSLDNKKYIALSRKLDEVGKMLGGWNGQLTKQNSPAKSGEK